MVSGYLLTILRRVYKRRCCAALRQSGFGPEGRGAEEERDIQRMKAMDFK